jgi:pyruvate/2-oxoglutarate dehydrogenase complex dihydrolipoamide dehydrogenase (E3) component
MVKYYDNQNILKVSTKTLIYWRSPIGIEMAQAFQKLGATIAVCTCPWQHYFLQHDDPDLTTILKDLKKSGMEFHFNSEITHFESANKGSLK